MQQYPVFFLKQSGDKRAYGLCGVQARSNSEAMNTIREVMRSGKIAKETLNQRIEWDPDYVFDQTAEFSISVPGRQSVHDFDISQATKNHFLAGISEIRQRNVQTKTHPQGKLNSKDEGEVEITIAVDPVTKMAVFKFMNPISWFAMPGKDLKGLIAVLQARAEELDLLEQMGTETEHVGAPEESCPNPSGSTPDE